MITPEQAAEIQRLASLWATARVRKNLVRVGKGGPAETPEGVARNADRAEKALDDYLQSITEQP